MPRTKIKVTGDLKNLNVIIKNLEGRGSKALSKIALVGEQIFVDESPVDTGVLRANWFVTRNLNSTRTFKRKRHKPTPLITVSKAEKGLAITNNINYVNYANVTSFRKNYLEKAFNIFTRQISKVSFLRKL